LSKMLKKGVQQLTTTQVQEFIVNLTTSNDNEESEGVKRTIKDFRKLMQVLDKTSFGCYVPYIPQIKATEDMP